MSPKVYECHLVACLPMLTGKGILENKRTMNPKRPLKSLPSTFRVALKPRWYSSERVVQHIIIINHTRLHFYTIQARRNTALPILVYILRYHGEIQSSQK